MSHHADPAPFPPDSLRPGERPSGKPAPDSRTSEPPGPRRSPRSAWLVLGLAAVLLWVLSLRGTVGIAAWMLATGLLLLVTALYSLAFRRRSWAALDTVPQKRLALTGSGLVLVAGMAAAAVAAPQLRPAEPTAEDVPEGSRPESGALPPPLPAPAEPPAAAQEPDLTGVEMSLNGAQLPGGTSPAGGPCATPGEAVAHNNAEYRCTQNDAGLLVWMERTAAERLAAQRAERARDAAQQPPAPRPANPPSQQPPATQAPGQQAPGQQPPPSPSPEPSPEEPTPPAPSPSAPPSIPEPVPSTPSPQQPAPPSPTNPGTPRIPSPQPPSPSDAPRPPSSPRIAEPVDAPEPASTQAVG